MMSDGGRTMIAAFQMSIDGYMQGADGGVDWVDSWNDARDLIPDVDACVLGAGMYPGYESLWGAIAENPEVAASMLGRPATAGEVDYARWTQGTPHYVLSTSLDTVNWSHSRVIRSVEQLRALKSQPGGNVYVIGGPSLVSNLLNEGLIDELHVIVHPLILGEGKSPFSGVTAGKPLSLIHSQAARSGRVVLAYRC